MGEVEKKLQASQATTQPATTTQQTQTTTQTLQAMGVTGLRNKNMGDILL